MARMSLSSNIGFLAVISALIALPTSAQAQDVPEQVREMMKKMLSSPQAEPGEQAAESEEPKADTPQSAEEQPSPLTEAEVEVSTAGTVTLNVVDLPLSTVLRVLSLETNRNIIATPAVDGMVTASLHDVTFEEALDAILLSNQAAYRSVGKFIYVYTQEELAEIIASENPPETRVFRLSYVRASDVQPAIAPLLSSIGQMAISVEAESGISSDSDEAGGTTLATSDYIVVHDRKENLDAMEAVVRQLDVRPKQVLVEATILSAELDDENAMGVDFTVLGGVDLELLGSSSTAIQDLTMGNLPTARFEKFNANATTDFSGNVPSGGLHLGILQDHVAVFVRALEEVTDTVVLANPKVLALNKQKGQVIVGRRDGYITTTVTETQAIQNVEFLETGTQLIFRPFIGEDGFVRMELHPEDSIGGVTASNLPFEQTTEVTTNIIVKDGQTILIGGLFREVDSDNRSQLPILGDIPALGTLFQSRDDRVRRQEVIILLTVHLIKDFDSYAKQSWDEFEDIERVRVGLRQAQMWHSRERIAQALYKKAVDCKSQGNLEDAQWYVRMALHNNPRFAVAIKLQEELRGKRDWDEDGTITRSFIQRAIMEEQGLSSIFFGRPQALTGNTQEDETVDLSRSEAASWGNQ